MKKISLGGVSVALVVVLFYTFVFCMTGNTYNGQLPVAADVYYTDKSEVFDNYEPKSDEYDASADDDKDSMKDYIVTTDDVNKWRESKGIEQSYGMEETFVKIAAKLPAATSGTVKIVTAAETTSKMTETSAPVTTTAAPASTTVPVTTTAAPVTTVQTTAATTAPAVIKPTNEKLSYTVNGTRYYSDAYDAVCQIVNAEMGSTFNEEALKAQAVAAYSYLKYSNLRGVSPSVSIKGNVPSKVSNAVSAVLGQAVYYNGSIAQTVYSSSNGGYSASAEDVWGGEVPYLVSVESPYDKNGKYYGFMQTYSESEVKRIIENSTGISLSGSPQNWITLLPDEQGGTFDGGYVGKILIDGNSSYNKNGTKINLTGRVLRENIFNYSLRSSKFTVSYSNGTFTFTTYGYGHGVGMSQIGANGFAQDGYTYKQILEHYYSGANVQ